MTLVIEIANTGGDEWDPDDLTDITDKVLIYGGMRVGGNAHQGEIGTGSGFDLDDDGGEVTLPVRRVIRIKETATSPDTILVRGRIAGKGVTRGAVPVDDARRYDVEIDDANIELRGIVVKKWSRPRESDYARVIALWKRFLKGAASTSAERRLSTRLVVTRDGDPRWVRNANKTTLPKQTYTDTDPYAILRDIAEAAGKEFFVTADREIFYDLPTSVKYAADISITDDDPDETDSFPPIYAPSGDQDGSEFLSGASITYGNKKRASKYRPGAETAHDKWREVIPYDATGLADAKARIKSILSGQAKEDRTYTVAVDLPATDVDRIKYGQTVSFRSAAAGVLSPVVLRVGRLLWEPLAPGRYRGHMELGFPKKLAPRIRGGHGRNPGNRTSSSGEGPEVYPPASVTVGDTPDYVAVVSDNDVGDGDTSGFEVPFPELLESDIGAWLAAWLQPLDGEDLVLAPGGWSQYRNELIPGGTHPMRGIVLAHKVTADDLVSTDAVFRLTPTGGDMAVTYRAWSDPEFTVPDIPDTVTAAALQQALAFGEYPGSPTDDYFDVTGPDGGPFDITFRDTYAAQHATLSATNATVEELTAGRGLSFFVQFDADTELAYAVTLVRDSADPLHFGGTDGDPDEVSWDYGEAVVIPYLFQKTGTGPDDPSGYTGIVAEIWAHRLLLAQDSFPTSPEDPGSWYEFGAPDENLAGSMVFGQALIADTGLVGQAGEVYGAALSPEAT